MYHELIIWTSTLLLSSNKNICISAPFYVLLHESNDSNKLKLVGGYHNASTHEQLSHAKNLKYSKATNNYV